MTSTNTSILPSSSRQLPMPLNGPDDLEKIARVMVNSRFFGNPEGSTPEEMKASALTACFQAQVKIMAGAELGLPPFAAMRSMHIVEGKPVLGYQTVGALINMSGKYRFLVHRKDATGCKLEFQVKEDGKWIPCPGEKKGISEFTEADMKRGDLANKKNWQRWAEQMYFSRALTNGANTYCPELSQGAIYTPDDLNIEVDEAGEIASDATPVQSEVVEDPKPSTSATADAALTASATTDVEAKDAPKSGGAGNVEASENTVANTVEPTSQNATAPAPATTTEEANELEEREQAAKFLEKKSSVTVDSPSSDSTVQTTPEAGSAQKDAPQTTESASPAKDAKVGDNRPGRPTNANLGELLQIAEKSGIGKADANAMLTQYLIANLGLNAETVGKFKEKWTWADYDNLVVLFSKK